MSLSTALVTRAPMMPRSAVIDGNVVDERFGKARRLLRRADFVRVQGSGASGRSRHFIVLVSREARDGPARLGIVASRKVGNAVARNRGRRLVREWFRRRTPLPDGMDVVVILRAGAPALAASTLEHELEATLTQALRARRGPTNARRAGSRR